ncbi:hypothetical protein HAX54_047977 [Datura stramonium]|uniref:MADS-box domain-containing protein n=1 Tax=Datura stramonium TaxID=4076 RepID=A0ABS8ST41_DATST|nr:hypothetical protein [Datura stramonium]
MERKSSLQKKTAKLEPINQGHMSRSLNTRSRPSNRRKKMGRSKINMELIEDHKNRKSSFMKRKASLVKKIREVSILCDIKACMMIYEGNNEYAVSEIWPNDSKEVEELINLYKNQPMDGRSKRDKTLSSFFENKKKNNEMRAAEKYPIWDSRFDYLSEEELRNLARILEKKMENAKGIKAQFINATNSNNIGSSSLSHQQIWDNLFLMNQTTPPPAPPIISYNVNNNNFFQPNIPSAGRINNELLTIHDYQFGIGSIEAEHWVANTTTGIGSSSTMKAMDHQQFPFSSTYMPHGFQ